MNEMNKFTLLLYVLYITLIKRIKYKIYIYIDFNIIFKLFSIDFISLEFTLLFLVAKL